MVHGAAGSTAYGAKMNMWSPAATGADLRSVAERAGAARAGARAHHHRQQHRLRQAEAFTTPEIGGDHFRASAVFLTQAHPKQTMGSDVLRRHLDRPALRAALRPGHADPVDAAVHRDRRSGRRLRIRLLLRLHRLDQLGVADEPLPMIRDPRTVFDQLFGVGATAEERAARRREDRSILDTLMGSVGRLKAQLGAADQAAARRLPRRRARDRAPHPEGRGVQHAAASSASCPARRSACPTPTKSTSS